MQKAGGTGTSNPNLGAYQVIREQVEMFFLFEQEAYWSHWHTLLGILHYLDHLVTFCHISWANPGTEHEFHLRSGPIQVQLKMNATSPVVMHNQSVFS